MPWDAGQFARRRLIPYRDDQEHRVGAVHARLVDLVLVDQKVLAQNRGASFQGGHLFSDIAHIRKSALEPGWLGQNRDPRGSGLGIFQALLPGDDVQSNIAFARRCTLNFSNNGDSRCTIFSQAGQEVDGRKLFVCLLDLRLEFIQRDLRENIRIFRILSYTFST